MFSMALCYGVHTSYGSYNELKKPIVGDAIRIAVTDTSFSFLAGLATFSVIGHLRGFNSPVSENKGDGLGFIAFPAVMETLDNPRFWTFFLFLLLFVLGFDSAIGDIEATVTIFYDLNAVTKIKRNFYAFVCCVIGAIGSLMFCSN